jgi:hypothetical protein
MIGLYLVLTASNLRLTTRALRLCNQTRFFFVSMISMLQHDFHTDVFGHHQDMPDNDRGVSDQLLIQSVVVTRPVPLIRKGQEVWPDDDQHFPSAMFLITPPS